jgi:hypothetical protein
MTEMQNCPILPQLPPSSAIFGAEHWLVMWRKPMQVMRVVGFLVLLMAFWAAPAAADVQDYCAAVARDFADLRPQDRTIWQQRYDDSERDCIADFSTAPAETTTDVTTKPKEKLKKTKPIRIEAPMVAVAPEPEKKPKKKTKKAEVAEATTADATTEQTVAVPTAKAKLAPGSSAWLDYCERKYTSFNRDKGTYRSKTGVERKCLVTADFR